LFYGIEQFQRLPCLGFDRSRRLFSGGVDVVERSADLGDELLFQDSAILQHALAAGEAILLFGVSMRAFGQRKQFALEFAQASAQRFVQPLSAEGKARFKQLLRACRPASAAEARRLMRRKRATSILSDIHEQTL
jgi:hypothetical protein